MQNQLYKVEVTATVKRVYMIEALCIENACETATKNEPEDETTVEYEVTSATKITDRK